MSNIRSALLGAALLALPALVVPALAQPAPPPPAPASAERGMTVRATVESIDRRSRQVVLRSANGEHRTVRVGPEVRNLAQIHPGDVVVVTLGEAINLEMANPADGAPPVETLEAAARALPGRPPGGGAMQLVRARVTINAVDPSNGTVTFTGPMGVQRTVRPTNADISAFVRRLAPGELVDVTYGESVMIRVEPRARR